MLILIEDACRKPLHFHIHPIPHWHGGGKGFDWTLVRSDPEPLRAIAKRIRAAL